MAPQPRLSVVVAGKVVGHVFKSRTTWHFSPNQDTPLAERIKGRTTLKRLGEDIKQAISAPSIKFHEIPRASKAAPQKRSSSETHTGGKFTVEEQRRMMALEREQARYSPRGASLESRDGVRSFGLPVSGGIPGLGKRR